MPDYANGKIYKIVNTKNDKIYIGSTVLTLSKRMGAHRYYAKDPNCVYGKFSASMRRHGVDNFEIKLVKDYPCDAREQLIAKEFQIIKKYLAKGVKLYNTTVENGKSSEETKTKLRGKFGATNNSFNRGCICYYDAEKVWTYQWRENGVRKKKQLSANIHGYEEAKRLIEEFRDKTFPID